MQVMERGNLGSWDRVTGKLRQVSCAMKGRPYEGKPGVKGFEVAFGSLWEIGYREVLRHFELDFETNESFYCIDILHDYYSHDNLFPMEPRGRKIS